MSLIDKVDPGSGWQDSNLEVIASTGSVIVSAELSGSGEELSGEYELVVSARAGGTGTITVEASTPNNPYNGKVIASLAFDDTTEHENIVPGVKIILDSSAVDTDEAIVNLGQYKGSFDASGVGAGTPTAGVRHQVENDGASEVIDAKVRLLTQAVLVKLGGDDLFSTISPFAEDAIEKTAGGGSDRVMPYKFTASSISGSGPSKTCTLQVDGSPIATDYIQDLDTGGLQDGTLLKAVDPPHYYQFVDGPLKGLQFSVHENVANTDEANVLVFNSRYVQIAPDVGGSAGTYGTSDVDLTQSGQATGVILASGVAYYWRRELVPSGGNNESNPHPLNVALQANLADEAGWEA